LLTSLSIFPIMREKEEKEEKEEKGALHCELYGKYGC
jgi:hypothetical protein